MAGFEPTIRAITLNGLREFCASRGVDAGSLLKSAGLKPQDDGYGLEDTIALNAFAGVLNAAADASKDPCFGLNFAMAYPTGATGLIGQLVLRSATVREAVIGLKDFISIIVNPMYTAYHEDDAGQGVLEWWFHDTFTAPRLQMVSFSAALTVLRLRQGASRDWIPAAFELEHRELPCRDRVTEVFGKRVRYNCERNRLVVPAPALAITIKSSDPSLLATLKHYAASELGKSIEPADFVARVGKVVLQNLASGTVTLDVVADHMKVSPRSVQWQLSQAGTTFEKVLSETRRRKAEPMLKDTDLPLSEIAAAVGFSELSSFSRAASGWFGMSPRAYRQKFRAAAIGKAPKATDAEGGC